MPSSEELKIVYFRISLEQVSLETSINLLSEKSKLTCSLKDYQKLVSEIDLLLSLLNRNNQRLKFLKCRIEHRENIKNGKHLQD